jgi:hypothetical protein
MDGRPTFRRAPERPPTAGPRRATLARRCAPRRHGPVADVALEAPSVAALRSLGAICIGKTQMQASTGPL